MNLIKKIVAVTMTLSMILITTNVARASSVLNNGTYTANTNTYYINPDTGVSDDSSSNTQIGESMCRSVIFKDAVIEKTDLGTYVTVRVLLYSNLSDLQIALKDNNEYREIEYDVVKESLSMNYADVRFEVSDSDKYIQTKAYINPMEREVTFYWNYDLSTVVSGRDSFDNYKKSIGNKEEKSNKFLDINNHWAKDDINKVTQEKLFSGTSENTFSPDEEMTRGMFVTVLGRLSGEKIYNKNNKFTDVDNNKYYASYIAWASENKIVSGVESDKFQPDKPVTCEQAGVIIARYMKYKNIPFKIKGLSPIKIGLSSWAKDDVVKVSKAGIITKENTNGYDYTSKATRADVASMFANYIKYYR